MTQHHQPDYDTAHSLYCWTTTAAPKGAAYLYDEKKALLAVFPHGDETDADSKRLRTAELSPRLALALAELYAVFPEPRTAEQWAACIEAEEVLGRLHNPNPER